MRLDLSPGSIVLVELRATGLLQSLGHSPTLSVRPEPFSIDVPDPGAGGPELDLPIRATFSAFAIEPPADLSASDREKMRDNMLGADVLDARRHPIVEVRGTYRGTFSTGSLSAEAVVRGAARPIVMPIQIEPVDSDSRAERQDSPRERAFVARGRWEGRLTDLGIKPFRALLGALRLQDWTALRLEAHLRSPSTR